MRPYRSALPIAANQQSPIETRNLDGGGGEIRTHEAFGPSGFQDRRNQPLCHPSGALAGGVDAGPRSATAATTCHCSELEQGDWLYSPPIFGVMDRCYRRKLLDI